MEDDPIVRTSGQAILTITFISSPLGFNSERNPFSTIASGSIRPVMIFSTGKVPVDQRKCPAWTLGKCPDNRIHTSARLDRRWRFNTVLVAVRGPRRLAASPPSRWRMVSILRTTYARLGAGRPMAGAMEACAQTPDAHVGPWGLPMIQFPRD